MVLSLVATPGTLDKGASGAGTDRRLGEVNDLLTQLGQDFEPRNKLYETIENTLHGDRPVKVPEAYDKTGVVVRSPMPSHIVNTIVAALSVNDPVVQFQPLGFGNAPTENATKREQFFEASWLRQEREAKRRLFRLFMYSLIAKGEGILKTVERSKSAWGPYHNYQKALRQLVDKDRALDYDAKDRYFDAKSEEYKAKHAPYPIKTTDVVPETFLYLKGEDGFNVNAEVKEVPYFDTLTRFNMALNSKGEVVPEAMGLPVPEWQRVMRGTSGTLKMGEVWTWSECNYVMLGPGQFPSAGGKAFGRGTLVRTIKNHGYGNPMTRTLMGPYFHAHAITTATRLPHKAGLGILYAFLDLFPLLDSMLTIAHNNAIMTGFASFVKKRSPSESALRPRGANGNPYGEDGDEDDDQSEVIEPGYVYPDDIGPLEMPRAGVDFDKFIQLVRGFLEMALPSIVQGVVGGDESGYALNQAQHLARLAWDPILDNAEFALSDRVGFESYLISRHIGERVYAWGEQKAKDNPRKAIGTMISISPEELGDNHTYNVKLDPQTPSNKSLELKYHIEAEAAGYESKADGIEALGGSADQVKRQRLYEKFEQHPKVEERIFDRAMQKLGWIDQEEIRKAEEEMALADSAASPGASTPGTPGQGALGPVGEVYAPGVNMPEGAPTPAGARTGMGPAGRALAGGNPPGSPYQPANLPPSHLSLPGGG